MLYELNNGSIGIVNVGRAFNSQLYPSNITTVFALDTHMHALWISAH